MDSSLVLLKQLTNRIKQLALLEMVTNSIALLEGSDNQISPELLKLFEDYASHAFSGDDAILWAITASLLKSMSQQSTTVK